MSQTKQLKTVQAQVAEVRHCFDDPRVAKALTDTLGKVMSPAKFRVTIDAAIRANPKLANCHPFSIVGSAIHVAEMGLSLSKGMRHAALVPFKDEAVPIIMYPGWIHCARRDKVLEFLDARVVWKWDEFSLSETQLGTVMTHIEKYPEVEKPGFDDIVAAYARGVIPSVVPSNSPSVRIVVLHAWELERLRARSKGAYYNDQPKLDHPWHSWPDRMALAKACQAFFKHMPIGESLGEAMRVSDLVDTGQFKPGELFGLDERPRSETLAAEITDADFTPPPFGAADDEVVAHTIDEGK